MHIFPIYDIVILNKHREEENVDIHYNAFISYRHHPDDIRVASEIHRSLEHYRVPKEIRKKSKGITRLFRDKEELPITSDLSTDITRALRNSDYLIVICSTHTRESTWVTREIQTFLQTHDRNKVLTVLVNGEPYETIPEILLYDEKTDPITGQTEKIPIEPLSCDWRMPRRRARREELPRLAAALLGCGYNELRQRERQYRTRRLVATFSAALAASLCLTAYFVYTSLKIQRANEQLHAANERIQENLEQALENQSLFLANESAQLLVDGDRMTAMALAMEALPEYEGQRPYVAEAEMALSQALGAYDAYGSNTAVAAINCGALVESFVVTDDGKVLYILDARNMVSAWDTETLEHLGSASLSFAPSALRTCPSGNLLAYTTNKDVACCAPDGRILWSLSGYCGDMEFLEDGSMLMILDTRTNTGTIRFYDTETGEEAREPVEFMDPNENGSIISGDFLREIPAGGSPIYLYLTRSDKVMDIVAVDWDTGESVWLNSLTNCYIDSTCFTNDGNLVIMSYEASSYWRGTFLDMFTTGEQRGTLYCLDCATGEYLWETEISSYLPSYCGTLEVIPGSEDLMLLYDNVFHTIDSATGQILTRCESSSAPLWVNVQEDVTWVVLDDGSYGSFTYDGGSFDGTCSTIKFMKDQLTCAQRYDTLCYVSEELGTQVLIYGGCKDSNYQVYGENSDYISSLNGSAAGGEVMVIEGYGVVYAFDVVTRELLWSNVDDESYSSNVELLGFSEDEDTVWCIYERSPYELIGYDAESGAAKVTQMPAELDGEELRYLAQHIMQDDKLYCLAKGYTSKQQFLLRLDAGTGALEYWPVCTPLERESGFVQETILLAAADNYALVWESSTGTVYEISIPDGQVRGIAEGIEIRPVAEIWDEDRFLLCMDHKIYTRNFGGEVTSVIDLGDKNAGALRIREDVIFAICDDVALYRYDLSGSQLSRTELNVYTSFYSELAKDPKQVCWFFTDDGDLIIDACGAGNIIDCGTWQLRAYIPSFVTYDPAMDEILVKPGVNKGSGVLCYPRYATEDIVSMAREALGSFALTDDQKAAYGLLEE